MTANYVAKYEYIPERSEIDENEIYHIRVCLPDGGLMPIVYHFDPKAADDADGWTCIYEWPTGDDIELPDKEALYDLIRSEWFMTLFREAVKSGDEAKLASLAEHLAGIPTHHWEGVKDAAEWLKDSTADDYHITAWTTDEQLDEIANEIYNDALVSAWAIHGGKEAILEILEGWRSEKYDEARERALNTARCLVEDECKVEEVADKLMELKLIDEESKAKTDPRRVIDKIYREAGQALSHAITKATVAHAELKNGTVHSFEGLRYKREHLSDRRADFLMGYNDAMKYLGGGDELVDAVIIRNERKRAIGFVEEAIDTLYEIYSQIEYRFHQSLFDFDNAVHYKIAADDIRKAIKFCHETIFRLQNDVDDLRGRAKSEDEARRVANEIVSTLNEKGADLGNVAAIIIADVLMRF